MTNLRAGWIRWVSGLLSFFLLGAGVAGAADPTAFELIKEGNRYLGEQSKDKVLGIRSEKSLVGLTPSIWYVAYYDPDAKSRRAEVEFGAGRQMGITHNWRPLGGGGSLDKLLDLKKLKVDSDQAVKTATAEPLLAQITIRATQLWLENSGAAPVWRVRLWASKLKQPDVIVDIGELFISAESGEVVKSDLRVNKVG